ncbi:MAG TPA: hypothetical protein VFM68_04225 [Candidatus Saccharimonadales bacterium]|nr:hypothetical protein [Candidatus Saccharimonadales bacterium]
MKRKTQQQYQSGAVALFVVVFATLLMMIITLSFVQLMIKDQQQATANDLSQSAYDSAQSGVEDAKRLLLLGQACRSNAAPSSVNCSEVLSAIDSGDCNTVATVFGDPNTETLIQQDEADEALQQAYTCIIIDAQTVDYKGQLEMNQSNIIPLEGVGEFNRIQISWFTRADIADATSSLAIGFPGSGPSVSLPRVGSQWGLDNPALLRAQFMQTGSSFTLADFDDNQAGNTSNANTLFLYPSETGASDMSFALDARRSSPGAPQQADCVSSFSVREYACTVTLALPNPIDGDTANRGAYLRLGALYNTAHYKIELLNGSTPVLFDQVQPEVDSTGRANDMFRRVKSRIELKSDFTYPEAAIDLEGDLCKNFIITADPADYQDSTTCTP